MVATVKLKFFLMEVCSNYSRDKYWLKNQKLVFLLETFRICIRKHSDLYSYICDMRSDYKSNMNILKRKLIDTVPYMIINKWIRTIQQEARGIYNIRALSANMKFICTTLLETGRKNRDSGELFSPVSKRVQIKFIFADNARIFCVSCNVKQVTTLSN
jgi:hypothetical protein